jgi:hypothetical protein
MFSIVPRQPDGAIHPTFAKVIQWGLGLVACVAIGLIAGLIIKGVLAIAAAVLIGIPVVKLAPWVSIKMSNLALKLIKYEARQNPVETRQRISMERWARFREEEKKLIDARTQVRAVEGRLSELGRQYPKDAARFQAQMAANNMVLNSRTVKLRETRVALEQYDEKTKRVAAIYEMSMALMEVTKITQRDAEKDALRKIQDDEAIKAVDEAAARVFAEIEHESIMDGIQLTPVAHATPAAIQHQPAQVIDMGIAQEVKKPVHQPAQPVHTGWLKKP